MAQKEFWGGKNMKKKKDSGEQWELLKIDDDDVLRSLDLGL